MCIHYFIAFDEPQIIPDTLFEQIDRPTLLLDEKRCKRNISRIVKKAGDSSTEFRPHFKTHQSHEIGKWFRQQGVNGITVSTVEMALYFASDGWNDITIAFPFYPAMIKKLQILNKECNIRLFVNKTEHLELINKSLNKPVRFYIEVDAGYGRSGISFQNRTEIENLIHYSENLGNCNFHGFYIHNGDTYRARSKDEIRKLISPSFNALLTLKKEYPDAAVSLGDTPSMSVLDSLEGLDECTPGNLVFYDWMQVTIGSCTPDDIALYALLPVAQRIPQRDLAIIHGGAVHLSKDYIETEGMKNYGQRIVYGLNTNKVIGKSFLTALSQEHGTLKEISEPINDEYVTIIPIHSCLTANLFNHYITTNARRIEKRVLS